jgi:NAD-dependent dihydropyrimidine dehydrogenase PreA subunit
MKTNTCPCGSLTTTAETIGSRPCQCHECRLCEACIAASEAHARVNNEVGDTRVVYTARTTGGAS